jgi:hypothetical protein
LNHEGTKEHKEQPRIKGIKPDYMDLYRFQLGGMALLHAFTYVPLLFNLSTPQHLSPSTILKRYKHELAGCFGGL